MNKLIALFFALSWTAYGAATYTNPATSIMLYPGQLSDLKGAVISNGVFYGNAAGLTNMTASYIAGTLTNSITGNSATATLATTATIANAVAGTLTNSTTGNAATATSATTAGSATTATLASYVSGTLTNDTTGNAATATLVGAVTGALTNNTTGDAFGPHVSAMVPDVDITGYQADPNNYDAFPGMVKLANGTLLLVYRTGTNHLYWGSLVKRTSIDLGKTWSAKSTVMTDALDLRDPSITILQSGKIVMTFFKYHWQEIIDDPLKGVSTGPWVTISDNSGVSWSTPTNIGTITGSTAVAAVSSPAVEMGSNVLALASYGNVAGIVGVNPPSDIQIYHSTDGGVNWTQSGGITNANMNAEPNLCWTGGNNLLMTLRNDTSHYIATSFSTDAGLTWSAPSDQWAGTASPRLFKAASGNVYCFYRANASPWQLQANNMFWRISPNDGVSWGYESGAEWQGLRRDYDYASIVELSPGTLGIAYALHYVSGPPCNLFFKTLKDAYIRPSLQAANAKFTDGMITLDQSTLRIKDASGYSDVTPNAGRLTIANTVGLAIKSPVDAYGPVLGTNTGPFSMTDAAGLYGIWAGTGLTGDFWLQAQRSDASTVYKLNLNPLGGNVRVGVPMLDAGAAKLTLGSPDAGEAGLRLKAGSTAKGIELLGRTTSDGEGYLQFFNYDGSVLQGAIYGKTNQLTITDQNGADVITVRSNKVGVGMVNSPVKFGVAQIATTAAPTLGTASGGFELCEPGGTYGLIAGINASGLTWLQGQRFDGTATSYDILLNPSGGNVTIGTATTTAAQLTLGEPDTGQTGIYVKSGSTAAAIDIIGRSDGQGVLAFRDSDGILEGSLSGATNRISLNDTNGSPRVAVSDAVVTMDALAKINARSDGAALQIIGRAADDQGYIQFFEKNGTVREGSIYGDNGRLTLTDASDADVLAVYSSKVGILTNTPSQALEVRGNAKAISFIGPLTGNADTATTATNAPDGYGIASTNFVLGAIGGVGRFSYFSGVTNVGSFQEGAGPARTNSYQSFTTVPAATTTQTFTGLTTGAYIRHNVSTQSVSRILAGPCSVVSYAYRSGGGGTVSCHYEVYALDMVTGLLHELGSSPSQVITGSSTSVQTVIFSVSIATTYVAVNETRIAVACKLDSVGTGGPSLTFLNGGVYDAHVSFIQALSDVTIDGSQVTGTVTNSYNLVGNSTADALRVKGSMSYQTQEVGWHTIYSTNTVFLLSTSGANVNLPSATTYPGRVITVKLIAPAATGTVTPEAGSGIDGATPYSLSSSNKFVTVISDGNTNWWVIGNN